MARKVCPHSPDERRHPGIYSHLEQEIFVILPHPQVLGYMRKKTEDYDRWMSGTAKV